jgi:hypothetical protein
MSSNLPGAGVSESVCEALLSGVRERIIFDRIAGLLLAWLLIDNPRGVLLR